jgi:hypothetical protein
MNRRVDDSRSADTFYATYEISRFTTLAFLDRMIYCPAISQHFQKTAGGFSRTEIIRYHGNMVTNDLCIYKCMQNEKGYKYPGLCEF